MAALTFDQIADAAKALKPPEQERLKNLLELWLLSPPTPPPDGRVPTEEEFEEELLREGILDHVPPPITDLTPYQDRELVEIPGEPLSETIIKDRR